MLRALLTTRSRLPAFCVRHSCWCPEEPFDRYTRVTYLPCGVRVITEENTSPLACVSLICTVGARYETSNSNGLTHFIEHLAYKGFKKMRRSLIECTTFTMGAKLSIKTKRDMQIFQMLLPAPLAASAVKFLAHIVVDLEFDQKEIDKERANICMELLDTDRNPKAVVFDYLHATAFQGTPLAQPVIGPMRNISKFDKLTAKAFVSEQYTSCRLILATSGGVHHEQMSDTAASTLGTLPPLGIAHPEPGPNRFTASEVIYRDDSMPYAHVAIAVEAPGYNHVDYLKMLVTSCMIGRWDKSQGRPLTQPFYTAQGAGLLDQCQSYEAFYIAYKDIGLWGVYFVGNKHELDEMVTMVQHAWMKLCVMTHKKELERAVNMTKMLIARRYDGVVNSCRDLGIQMLYACTRVPFDFWCNRLNCLVPNDIKEACDKYVYNQGPAVVAMGPTECLPEYNRTLSGMYWLRF